LIEFRDIFPRLALAALFVSAAIFAYFEGVYLADQWHELHDTSIATWMWLFRGITLLCFLIATFFIVSTVRAFLTR
jgi:hypothetical protein